MQRHWARLPDALPFIFFGLLFLFTVQTPPVKVFDEYHYVDAAKELISLESGRNWEHPPLAKLIMGASWKIFTQKLDWLEDLVAMRLMVILFGMGVLVLFRRWCIRLEFGPSTTRALVWTVGFNMCWYVQSKTAMLDMFALFFGLAGMLAAAHAADSGRKDLKGPLIAGTLLGLGAACKWNVLPFILISLWFARRSHPRRWAAAIAGAVLAYGLAFTPLTQVERGAIPPQYLLTQYQARMLNGLQSTSESAHSYRSSPWQWLTLNRPMWYTFQKVPGTEPIAHHCVFMGGNPVIFIPGLFAMLFLVGAWLRHRRRWPDRSEALVFSFFTVPMIIWFASPRNLMFFYYFIPASLWYGPAMALALRKVLSPVVADRALWAFVVVAGAFFFFMLPILSGQEVPYDTFRTLYQPWMHKLNWI